MLTDAGIDDPVARFLPLSLAWSTTPATSARGAALTGPVVRGDAATVERNLRALAERTPAAVAAYVTLSRAAADLAAAAGRLDDAGRARDRGGARPVDVIRTVGEFRGVTDAARAAGRTVGLVPTMGFFHEGHLSLMRRAREERDVVAADASS